MIKTGIKLENRSANLKRCYTEEPEQENSLRNAGKVGLRDSEIPKKSIKVGTHDGTSPCD